MNPNLTTTDTRCRLCGLLLSPRDLLAYHIRCEDCEALHLERLHLPRGHQDRDTRINVQVRAGAIARRPCHTRRRSHHA